MSRPGEFLRFLLVEEEMLVDTAAERTGLTPQQIGGVIAGTLPVTQEVAEKLAKLAGTTAQLWLKLQAEQ
ncbi:MAG: hypothetical protein RL328_2252 [Acidobacteriota bacterium]|jgi:addiction module HigA family antidote